MAQRRPPYYGQPSLKVSLLLSLSLLTSFSFLHVQVLFSIATKGAPPLKNPNKWSAEFKDFLSKVPTNQPTGPLSFP